MTPGATAAAEELFRLKKLTSCSVAATSPDLKSALQKIRDAGGVSGIHLNLTEGMPVADPGLIPSLLDSSGSFPGLGVFIARAALGRLRAKELKIELAAQMEKFVLECGTPNHLDGHHHVHLVPQVAEIAAEICVSMNISRFRTSPACMVPKRQNSAKNFMFFMFKQFFSGRGERIYFNHGLSDRGSAVQITESIVNHKIDIYSTLRMVRFVRIELVVHPEIELAKKTENKGKTNDLRRQEYLFLKGLEATGFSTQSKND